ncbi:hypothetical protein AB4Y45_33295 [Paraburkholderia sp. EG287A]|uniref:hypothetical protein n=1 Tax=Paraburkholderia sp. EG287A TaxID=3237012 RepID=UPI0034D33316
MSSTKHPDWLDQVPKFETEDQLAQTQRTDVTNDPVVVGAALSAIADGLDAEAAQSAGQEEQAGAGGKVVVHGARFAMERWGEVPGAQSDGELAAKLAAARSALYGIAKTFDNDELRARAFEAYEATQSTAPASAAAGDEVVIGGRVYVRAGGFKQLADGRNLPVFIAEGHPDEREMGTLNGDLTAKTQFDRQLAGIDTLFDKLRAAVSSANTSDASRLISFIRAAVFSPVDGLVRVRFSPGLSAAPMLEAGVVIKQWIRDHEAELNHTEFARIDASLERLMMHLGMAAASEQAKVAANAPVYRFLKQGERIEATDEYLDDDQMTWVAVGEGLFKGSPYAALMKPVRRAVDVTSGRVPEEFLSICEDEMNRGTLTSLPLKLRFGAARGMSLDEVHDWMGNTRAAFVTAVNAAAAQKASKSTPAPRYLVMRGVENSSSRQHPLPAEVAGRKIHQVWRLLDEGSFLRTGKPSHHGNAFLDDISHDWAMTRDGKHIRYFAHSSEKGDLVDIILEFEE